MRTLVIVLAFNEEHSLPVLLDELRRQPADIVVIDDASSDRTAELATRAGVAVVSLPLNLGIGGAEQTGFLYAWERGYDQAVRLDGDGQHDPASLPELLAPLAAGSTDVVIGSRFIRRSGFQSSIARRFGMRILKILVRLLTGWELSDITSGLRAYNRRALEILKEHHSADFPEVDALLYLKRQGLTVREVPVVMRERQGGVSSISGWRSIYYMLKVIFSVLIESSRGKHE